MNDDQIIQHFVSNKNRIISVKTKKEYLDSHIELKNYLMTRYDDSDSINETIYRIYYHIDKRPTCKNCNHHVKFISFSKGFREFCSISCSKKFTKDSHIVNVTDEDIIKEFIRDDGKLIINKVKSKFIKEHGYYEYLSNRFKGITQWSEIIYLISKHMDSAPVCQICKSNKCFFDGFNKGYWNTCYNGRCCSKYLHRDVVPSDETVIDIFYDKNNNCIKDFTTDYYKNLGFYDYLMNRYDDVDENTPLSEIVYRIYHHIDKVPTCEVCGKKLNYINGKIGYSKTCVGCVTKKKSLELLRSRGIESFYNDKGNLVLKNLCHIHGDIEITPEREFMKNRIAATRLSKDDNLEDICPLCHPMRDPQTHIETIIKRILDEFNISYVQHYKDLFRYTESGRKGEVDFWLPAHNIAIECNGMYWHAGEDSYKKSLERYEALKKQNIRLLTFWEDTIENKRELIKSYLKTILNLNKTKIYGRNCIVKEISSKDAREFLDSYHLQGSINSKIKLGLFYKDELVEVMTFGSLRKSLGKSSEEGKYELYRLCTKDGMTVLGGASKLLSYFMNNYEWNEIISYCDKEISVGKVYEKIGFSLDKDIKKGYFYIDTNNHMSRVNRFSLRKDKINDGSGRTEEEIANSLGYLRCYTLGNLRYSINK